MSHKLNYKGWLDTREPGNLKSQNYQESPAAKLLFVFFSPSWVLLCALYIPTNGNPRLQAADLPLPDPCLPLLVLDVWQGTSPVPLSLRGDSTYLSWNRWLTRGGCCSVSDKTGCKPLACWPHLPGAVPLCCHQNCTTVRPESSGNRLQKSKTPVPVIAAPSKQKGVSSQHSWKTDVFVTEWERSVRFGPEVSFVESERSISYTPSCSPIKSVPLLWVWILTLEPLLGQKLR